MVPSCQSPVLAVGGNREIPPPRLDPVAGPVWVTIDNGPAKIVRAAPGGVWNAILQLVFLTRSRRAERLSCLGIKGVVLN